MAKKEKSAKVPRKRAPKPKPIQYLLKKNEKIWNVSPIMMEQIPLNEALTLAVSARLEQRATLLFDAQHGTTLLDGVEVVQGLENSLQKLKERFPSIKSHLALYEPIVGQS